MRTVPKHNPRFMFWSSGVIYVFSLEAYAIGSIPLFWIVCPLVVLGLMITRDWPRPSTLSIPLALLTAFTLWSLFPTARTYLEAWMSGAILASATASLEMYVGLRIMTVLLFIAAVVLSGRLARAQGPAALADALVSAGVLASVAALYIYVAQTTGLPEPPRTRIGTGGFEQGTYFAYGFHRAMGTFREPAHLAQWLITPFFCSLLLGSRRWASVLIGGTLCLTGSLTGIFACVLGLAIICIAGPLRVGATVKTVAIVVIVVSVSFSVFSMIAVPDTQSEVNLLDKLEIRSQPLLEEGGMRNGNRWYVYAYASVHDATFLGEGLGFANLAFSEHQGTTLTVSFLSLYFFTLYSTGYVGLTILTAAFVTSVVLCLRLGRFRTRAGATGLAALCAWLIAYGVHAEELNVMCAPVLAFLACGPDHAATAWSRETGLRRSIRRRVRPITA